MQIVVWRGGNQRGAVVAVENQHGAVCVALLLAPIGLRWWFFFLGFMVYVGCFDLV